MPAPGNVVDLTTSPSQLSSLFIVDTNIIVEQVIFPFLGLPDAPIVSQKLRADHVFQHLIDNNGTGVVTPGIFQELLHVAIRIHYNRERRQLGERLHQVAKYGVPIRDWTDLYKHDPTILQAFAADLDALRTLLSANNLLIVEPADLGSIESGRSYDAELVHLVGRYGLDSNDAAILMEARRCGVTEIVTFDRDLLRAQADFTICTWL